MTDEELAKLSTHEKINLQLAMTEELKNQVRKIAERIDRHLQAERRAKAAYSATFSKNIEEEEK